MRRELATISDRHQSNFRESLLQENQMQRLRYLIHAFGLRHLILLNLAA